jgi:acyl transferase domain-containing protein
MTTGETSDDFATADVAIIGMAGRFPGAPTLEEFWQNLRAGVESITPLASEDILAAGVEPAVLGKANYVKAAALLPDIELFDAAFFGYTPREAEIMDPQQRLFLECAWQAVEHAGYDAETYHGAIGVYAGASLSSYLFNLYANRKALGAVSRFQLMLGNDKDHLPTRVSYKLNLKGPSVAVQTTCSTSLVAVHLACQSLLNGECDMALAGGVSIKVPQKIGYLYQAESISSPDGHTRTFDAKAQGTITGSGVGIVVLKRLPDALTAHDQILAVIKGTAVNNDGSLKVGYTAPSIEGQAKVIAEALDIAGIEPTTISYVEAHGTGTTLGDPVELTALTKAFRATTAQRNFCAVGSVKTNIGHLDAAAGIAGLIKTVLALQHKQLPPSLNFEQPNPKIDFGNSPFYVNATLKEWPANGTPRRAGVSSFGIGGTNAHVIVEEAPAQEPAPVTRPWQLCLLSAKTETALEAVATNLAAYLQQAPAELADVAYTLQVGRRAFKHRRMFVCRDLADAAGVLANGPATRLLSHVHEPQVRPVIFMFAGQGTQYVNMGLELYRHEATFRAEVDRCAQLLMPQIGSDLRAVLYPPEAEAEAARKLLDQTQYTQPALFIIEYALARLWMAWGVRPAAFIGHSIGEYVAACLAGVLSLEDALTLVTARARLMQSLPAGAMLAVTLSEQEVLPLIGSRLSLASVNTPQLCVVAGAPDAVTEFEQRMTERGVLCRRLHTAHAFHSEMMEPILPAFVAQVQKVKLNPPGLPYLSNVTGAWITTAEATDANYWATHLRQTVRFADGLAELLKEPNHVLLEIGPGQVLSGLAKRQAGKTAAPVVISSLQRRQCGQSDVEDVLKALGQLWLVGVSIDWRGFHGGARRPRVALPTYPFERQRYWIASAATEARPQTTLLAEKKVAQIQPAGAAKPVTEEVIMQQPNENGQLWPTGDAQQRIVTEQLRLMSQQLDILRRRC